MMATSKSTENGSKKPAAKKEVTTKTAASKPAAKKTASKTTSTSKKTRSPAIVTSAKRLQMIEEAAYYIAEKHGFHGPSTDHWLAAEKQIDSKLNA
ncbi:MULTISPECIES: DUF2934 domain-containing protein [unclassified Methylophilus]|uniref:DUF2934 domain-containing protein n=1 Tax=unclassified Methylophilus TaxID=2630143 RepID=UPI001F1B577B|nr:MULTISPECIES: DUF2934 domain-containing protein [unclassified Methylophilus]